MANQVHLELQALEEILEKMALPVFKVLKDHQEQMVQEVHQGHQDLKVSK